MYCFSTINLAFTTHLFITSQPCRSEIQAWQSWLLCSGSRKTHAKVSARLLSHLELRVPFRVYSGCWQNLIPCDRRTVFLLAVGWGSSEFLGPILRLRPPGPPHRPSCSEYLYQGRACKVFFKTKHKDRKPYQCGLMNYSKANSYGTTTRSRNNLCHHPRSPSRPPIPTTVPLLSPPTSNLYPIYVFFIQMCISSGHLQSFDMSFKSLSMLILQAFRQPLHIPFTKSVGEPGLSGLQTSLQCDLLIAQSSVVHHAPADWSLDLGTGLDSGSVSLARLQETHNVWLFLFL